MLSNRLLAVLGLFGLVAASPQIQVAPSNAADCPRTMCLDGINPECNLRWGGCFDLCQPQLRPTMPPCKSTLSRSTVSRTPLPLLIPTRSPRPSLPTPIRSPSTKKPLTPTKPPSLSTPQPTTSENCSSRTICVDYINECGQMYGGCHADCRPWPSYAPPPCIPSVTLDPSTLPTEY
ncbi:hypothetical protein CDEST_02632 [Colletotrichum destructivum]|uniref:Uncharacterized protein n=1 Tax=Colletotrichum destructivum TaxID=34406 RepID=A0AAX4I3P3_9PEZI|nr:hypothetical protein CDEST_02632 [Colletotrichum destructivum]